jgi:hypothetical protein
MSSIAKTVLFPLPPFSTHTIDPSACSVRKLSGFPDESREHPIFTAGTTLPPTPSFKVYKDENNTLTKTPISAAAIVVRT